MKTGIIYKVVNQINCKIYIGLTTESLSRRKASHNYKAKYKKDNHIFHNAIRKYGIKIFKWEIIWEGDSNLLSQKEIEYISIYNSYFKFNKGYNMTFGGEGNPGFKGKDAFRYSNKIYTFYHKNGNIEVLTQNDMKLKYNIKPSMMSNLISGRNPSAKGWRLIKDYIAPKNKAFLLDLFSFINLETNITEININRKLMCEKYNLNSTCLKQVCDKKRYSHNNWVLI